MSSRFEVIRGPYLADILDQPKALSDTLTALRHAPVLDRIADACTPDRFQRIVLTGMGSSCFGLHPLAISLVRGGWTPILLETSALIHDYPILLTASTLVVAVSQSGQSVETVRMLEQNAGRATVVAVTNQPASPLARQAEFTLLTAAGQEFSVSCKTYVTAQLALSMLGAALCGLDRAERFSELEPAPQAAADYLQHWQEHTAAFCELLRDVRHMFLIGRGSSVASAGTGALIIKESDHFPAEAMSSAGFRHGPVEMLEAGVFVGVFAGSPATCALNEGLFKEICGTAAKAALFSPEALEPECRLPYDSESLRPVCEILPIQMMTLALAALANREPGRFDRATKVTAVE